MTIREYAEAILVWREPDVADVEDVIKAAVEAEREACAQIAGEVKNARRSFDSSGSSIAALIETRIRARSAEVVPIRKAR